MNTCYTREKLDVLIPKLEGLLSDAETRARDDGTGEITGMPPMTRSEAMDFLHRLMELAHQRPLTLAECFMHGQLMNVFEQAIRAEMLGKKGRYFVVSEEQLSQLTGERENLKS